MDWFAYILSLAILNIRFCSFIVFVITAIRKSNGKRVVILVYAIAIHLDLYPNFHVLIATKQLFFTASFALLFEHGWVHFALARTYSLSYTLTHSLSFSRFFFALLHRRTPDHWTQSNGKHSNKPHSYLYNNDMFVVQGSFSHSQIDVFFCCCFFF